MDLKIIKTSVKCYVLGESFFRNFNRVAATIISIYNRQSFVDYIQSVAIIHQLHNKSFKLKIVEIFFNKCNYITFILPYNDQKDYFSGI